MVSGFHFAAFDKAGEKCTQGLECTVMVLSLCRNLCVAPAGSGCLGGRSRAFTWGLGQHYQAGEHLKLESSCEKETWMAGCVALKY